MQQKQTIRHQDHKRIQQKYLDVHIWHTVWDIFRGNVFGSMEGGFLFLVDRLSPYL